MQTETLIFGLLVIVSLVAMVVQRLKIPYTVALVVVGLLIAIWHPFQVTLTPELILSIFVPPLVFEAAFHLRYEDLKRDFFSLLALAVPGVILTTLIVGGILSWGSGLGLQMALVFGALIAATDPVAVVAIFRSLGVPRRLAVLVEGESLFNDGTAIVVFNLMLAVVLTGQFNLLGGISDFLRVAAGGVIVGLVLGLVVSRVIAQIDDHLIETTLTTILAFGAYLIAEQLNFSGVLAVVAAGLINGNIGPRGMSPTTRIVIFNFWEYVAFLSSSMVFLLIGLDVNLQDMLAHWQFVLWGIGAVLVSRVIVVYGLGGLVNRFVEPIPLRWQHVLTWGGLRGAICLALALSLPASFGPQGDLLRLMAFGVVLFTLLIQGTTMQPFIHRLRLVSYTEAQIDFEKRRARLAALRSGVKYLENIHHQGLISSHAWEKLKPALDQRVSDLTDNVREILQSEPGIEEEELETAYRELVRAQKSALLGLRRDNAIPAEAFDDLVAELDADLEMEERFMGVEEREPVSKNANVERAKDRED
ncbi:MAG: Na+/H+ antiporter [Chloroflexi bacterium]|nr:Na+/H+ antiporter [Chloroflexota bacterium]